MNYDEMGLLCEKKTAKDAVKTKLNGTLVIKDYFVQIHFQSKVVVHDELKT